MVTMAAPIPSNLIEVLGTAVPPNLSEAVAGTIFVMFLFKVGYFGRYLLQEVREGGFAVIREAKNRLALSLLIMGAGFSLKSFGDWWTLHSQNDGLPGFPGIIVPMYVFGAVCILWGGVCMLHSLNRDNWSPWTWAWLMAIAIGFGLSGLLY